MQRAIIVAERVAGEGIERAERLVHQHDPRPRRQRPGDADALALAARQFMRKTVAILRAVEPHQVEQFVHPRGNLRRRRAQQFRRDPDIAGDADMRKQSAALEHIADAAAQRDRIDRAHVLALDRDAAADRPRSAGSPAATAWSCRNRSRRRWREIRPRRPRARRRRRPEQALRRGRRQSSCRHAQRRFGAGRRSFARDYHTGGGQPSRGGACLSPRSVELSCAQRGKPYPRNNVYRGNACRRMSPQSQRRSRLTTRRWRSASPITASTPRSKRPTCGSRMASSSPLSGRPDAENRRC